VMAKVTTSFVYSCIIVAIAKQVNMLWTGFNEG